MLINKVSKAICFKRLIAGHALPLACRVVVMSALVVVPIIHADCLPSVPAGWQVPVYMSTHNDATHAVGYADGTLVDSSPWFLRPSILYGDNFPQLFSVRFVPCAGGDCFASQPFDVNQADYVGLEITRTVPAVGHPSVISITLTLDSWGHTRYTFVGACDASTNLLYGSYGGNTMAVISFGTPVAPPQ